MRVMPTLEGGLRIDVETETDWRVLEQIGPDALGTQGEDLAGRLGALMDEGAHWDDYVVPELQEIFSGQLGRVTGAVQAARRKAESRAAGAAGKLFIARGDGPEWYGALNQARLALETRHQFSGSHGLEALGSFPEAKRAAFLRSQFYCALQSLLLEHVLD